MKKLRLKLKEIQEKKGSILIGSLLLSILMMSLGLSAASVSLNTSLKTEQSFQSIVALSQAEGAVEKTVWELNNSYEPSCQSTCSVEGAEIVESIEDVGDNTKEITVESYVPNIENYKAKKKIRVRITSEPEIETFNVNQAILANKYIHVAGGATINGDVYSNGSIFAYGASAVNGNAYAVKSISDPRNRITGIKKTGVPRKEFPELDLDHWKNVAKSGGVYKSNYYHYGSRYTSLGPKEIKGNFVSYGSTKMNLTGPLYIKGNLTIAGSSEWKPDETLGSQGTVVIVDGVIVIAGGSKFYGNSSGGYILFVSARKSPATGIVVAGGTDGRRLVLYAPSGVISISGGSKTLGAIGEKVYVAGGATVDYDPNIKDSFFTTGPAGTWSRVSWQEMK